MNSKIHHLARLAALFMLLVLTVSTQAANQCVQPPSGIIAWWPFDETSGNTAQDRAGSHTGAYANNPAPAEGKVGGSLYFNGTNYVAVPDSDDWAFGTKDFTIELWANMDVVPQSGDIWHPSYMFVGHTEGPFDVAKWIFSRSRDYLYLILAGPGIGHKAFPLSPVPSPKTNQWYHLAFTRSGSVYSVFIDGVLMGSATNTDVIPNPRAPLTIGQAENLGFMNGRLDEVTIYNRAVTQAELQAIVNAGTSGKCKQFRVQPQAGGDTGNVTMRLDGISFVEGTTVKLTKDGETDIEGTSVAIKDAGSALTATFNLVNKKLGTWNLVLTDAKGIPVTYPNAFTIEQGGRPDVSAEIVGLNLIRVQREQNYWINYHNSGDIDEERASILITIPNSIYATFSADNLLSPFIYDPSTHSPPVTTEFVAVEAYIGRVPAGSNGFVKVKISTANSLPIKFSATPIFNNSDILGPSPLLESEVSQQGLNNAAGITISTTQKVIYWDYYFITPDGGLSTYSHPIYVNGDDVYTPTQLKEDPEGTMRWWKTTRQNLQIYMDDPLKLKAKLGIWEPCCFYGTWIEDNLDPTDKDQWFSGAIQEIQKQLNEGNLPTKDDCITKSARAALQGGGKDLLPNSGLPAEGEDLSLRQGARRDDHFRSTNNTPEDSPNGDMARWDGTGAQCSLGELPYLQCPALRDKRSLTDHTSFDPSDFPKNSDIHITAVSSFDPNDKVGSKGYGNRRFVGSNIKPTYLIAFENLDTATAPAQEVLITDDLSPNSETMDMNTLSLGPISFGDKVITPPPGLSNFATDVDLRPDKNLLVRINAGFDPATNILSWRFTSIDPATGELTTDPLEGFLPPNTDANAPMGSGNVLLTVMPKKNLASGTEIRNKATIVFDTNAPIETPEWLNTIDNTKPESTVIGLPPTQAEATFQVSWFGEDVDAGVKDYSLFVSEDDGAFTPWLTNTPDTQAMFTGQVGHRYAFYSVARDKVGNVEEAPTVADTMTEVTSIPTDQMPPIVTITTNAGDTVAGSGWYNIASSGSDGVLVNVTASDPVGVANLTCKDSSNVVLNINSGSGSFVLADGTHSIACTATDGLGNTGAATGSTAMPVLYQIDQTPPTLSPVVAPNPVLLNGNATANVNAADSTSGVASASSTCGSVVTSSIGPHLVNCSATDVAGNGATANTSYNVIFGFSGFFAPVTNPPVLNSTKAGQAIPLKWRLTDANGAPVTNLASVQVTVVGLSCALGTSPNGIEESTAGASGLQNFGDGNYQFNWKSPTTYGNSCKTMKLNIGEGAGMEHSALFQFRK